MKNTITLYHDMDSDTFMTFDDISYNYDCMRSEYEEDGDFFPWDSVQDFVNFHVDSGDLEEITAYLQSGQEIFPYYYSTETDSVYTAWDMYRYYIEQHDFRYPSDTFAAFMNVSPYDTFNAHYGFYKN